MVSGNAFTPEMAQRNRLYNEGYSDGYHRRQFNMDHNETIEYTTGYSVGIADRTEDEVAIKSGDFDGLTQAEQEAIYGVIDQP